MKINKNKVTEQECNKLLKKVHKSLKKMYNKYNIEHKN